MMESVLTAVVFAPGLMFLLLALCWLTGWMPPEKFVARMTCGVFSLMVAATAWLVVMMVSLGKWSVRVSMGEWFRAGEYYFPLAILADELSLPMLVLTTVLAGIVGGFSVRYLHREPGFFRFFLLLHLFVFGALMLFTAGSYDLLLFGWELVGVSSVLLIAFFDERPEPVRNAIRVFATYRIADLGLLVAIFVLHHDGTTLFSGMFPGDWPNQSMRLTSGGGMLAGFLLLMAASGKSAQGPFSGWLPRAMEGPTPSSSIFYGAISIHAGVFLLLRSEPIISSSFAVSMATVGLGLVTAFLATAAHRVASDAKTSIAYAAMAQVGVIFVEIGLGFPQFALLHLVGHAVVRTLQLLRAPSTLHDFHRIHAAAGGALAKTGEHYGLLPAGLRIRLYRFGLQQGFYDAWLDRLVILPVMRLSRFLR